MPLVSSAYFLKKRGVYGVLLIALIVVLWFGYSAYQKNAAQQAEEAAAQKAATDAAKSENLFKTENPLSNVKADPFEKTKKVLNPFEE